MKLFQHYADGYTYYLGIDTDKHKYCVDSERGKHNRLGYTTVDETGYKAVISPVLTSPLKYDCIPWNF